MDGASFPDMEGSLWQNAERRKVCSEARRKCTPNVYSSPQSCVSEAGSISVAHGTEVRVLGLEIRILFCEEEERCNYSTVLVQWITIQKVLVSQQQTEFDS
jgi:hypothetical protein